MHSLIAHCWLEEYSMLICVSLRTCRKHKDSPGHIPILQKEEVWHTIGVDVIGPLPDTPRGNRYIVTASCLFSKWPEAVALKQRTSEGVAEFLFQCFTRHGCCCIKISEEENGFVDEVCKNHGLKNYWTFSGKTILRFT